MNVFITGGTGNIGQYVTLALLERGHSVRMLTRTPDRIPAFNEIDNLKVIKGSITDFDIMENALQGCDAVIHMALGWGITPLATIDQDTRATAFLLDASERAGVKNFIYTSSTTATGPLRHGMNEDTALRIPNTIYGSNKAATEMYVLGFRQYYKAGGGEGAVVRMHRNIIRPGYTFSNPAVPGGVSEPDNSIRNIVNAIVNNQDLTFSKNDGTQFLASKRIAEVYVKLAESDLNEEIFYALGRNFISWYDIACMAKELCPESTSTITAIDDDTQRSTFDVEKINRVFGLSFDSTEDMREHVAWLIGRART